MAGDRPMVHVIDDDEAVRTSLAYLLTLHDFEVATYESGAAFLRAAAAGLSGCVLTDARMPGMNGVELLKQLSEMNFSLPIVVMTGYNDGKITKAMTGFGPVALLEKPFDHDLLIATLRSALANPGQPSR
ncbi:MAG TPA: response regulator [Bauldia sp.]|nr:response regulator [Bauldia sp.]